MQSTFTRLTFLLGLVLLGLSSAELTAQACENFNSDLSILDGSGNPSGYFLNLDGGNTTGTLATTTTAGETEVTFTVNAGGNYNGGFAADLNNTQFDPSQDYTLTANVTGVAGAVQVAMEYFTASYGYLGGNYSGLISPGDSGDFTASGTPVAGTEILRIVVTGSDPSVTQSATVSNVCLSFTGGSFDCVDNLVGNGSLDNDVGGWFDFTGDPNSVTHNTTDPFAGAGSGNFVAGDVAAFAFTDGVVPGNFISVSGQIRATNGSFGLIFKNLDNGTETYGGTGISTDGANFVQVANGMVTVPEGTDEIIIFAQSNDGSGGFTTGSGGSFDNVCITDEGPDPSFVFPVALAHFTGSAMDKENKLEWMTANEENSARFQLERSADGRRNWTTVAEVEAAGHSETARNYVAMDDRPLRTGYYRLRSVDTDGAFELSDVVVITRTEGATLVAFPNPFGNVLSVRTDLTEATDYQLLDALGRRVRTGRIAAGPQQTDIPAADLPTGRYLVRVGNETITVVK